MVLGQSLSRFLGVYRQLLNLLHSKGYNFQERFKDL